MSDKRYIVGEAEPWSLPYVGAGFADEVYDLQAADPHAAIAYCDTPDEAAALAERLNAYEAERDALARDLDICRADRSALAAARAWVRAHGQHPPSCGAVKGERCTCGLDTLRSE